MTTIVQTQADITIECDALKEMLLDKNRAYGDSALDPVRIFSRADTVEQILVRIDDKLSRLKRGHAGGEDVERDLLGYLILLRIARRRADDARLEASVALLKTTPTRLCADALKPDSHHCTHPWCDKARRDAGLVRYAVGQRVVVTTNSGDTFSGEIKSDFGSETVLLRPTHLGPNTDYLARRERVEPA